MGPLEMAGIAKVGTELFRLPVDIYSDVQNMKMTRRQLADNERARRFQRLMDLVNQSQAVSGRLSGARRLMNIRNAGGAPDGI